MPAVAVAALIVALVAVLISYASYRLAGQADKRAARAESREVRADERDERREQREIEHASERRRGQPIVSPGSISGGPTAPQVTHDYTVRNGGAAPITDLRLRIEDVDAKTVSTPVGGPLSLAPGELVHVGVSVPQPLPEGDLTLFVDWVDRDGKHTESTGLHPPSHA
jgi:hypothetical protein